MRAEPQFGLRGGGQWIRVHLVPLLAVLAMVTSIPNPSVAIDAENLEVSGNWVITPQLLVHNRGADQGWMPVAEVKNVGQSPIQIWSVVVNVSSVPGSLESQSAIGPLQGEALPTQLAPGASVAVATEYIKLREGESRGIVGNYSLSAWVWVSEARHGGGWGDPTVVEYGPWPMEVANVCEMEDFPDKESEICIDPAPASGGESVGGAREAQVAALGFTGGASLVAGIFAAGRWSRRAGR